MQKIAKNVKKYRKIKKLSQLRLSIKTGISLSTIATIETAAAGTTVEKLNSIAEGLGITLAELVTFEK